MNFIEALSLKLPVKRKHWTIYIVTVADIGLHNEKLAYYIQANGAPAGRVEAEDLLAKDWEARE
jgi:hypothetical protein